MVYVLKPDTVAKVFLEPTALEYKDNKSLQEAAAVRITEMQTKLFEVPSDLPAQVIVPKGVMINEYRRVIGYIMPFVKGTGLDKLTRTDSRLSYEERGKLLTNLYDIVTALHAKKVIIGDFNENNVIVDHLNPYLIDVDSMQFGSYQCRSFFPRFVAPELIQIDVPPPPPPPPEPRRDPFSRRRAFTLDDMERLRREQREQVERQARELKLKNGEKEPVVLKMVQPHSELTDWYSFLVIAMRLLIHTEPFGGVLKGVTLPERVTKNLTLFNPRVTYPFNAKPLRDVPRPILELFVRVFANNERLVPDRELFENIRTPVAPKPVRKPLARLIPHQQKPQRKETPVVMEYEDDDFF